MSGDALPVLCPVQQEMVRVRLADAAGSELSKGIGANPGSQPVKPRVLTALIGIPYPLPDTTRWPRMRNQLVRGREKPTYTRRLIRLPSFEPACRHPSWNQRGIEEHVQIASISRESCSALAGEMLECGFGIERHVLSVLECVIPPVVGRRDRLREKQRRENDVRRQLTHRLCFDSRVREVLEQLEGGQAGRRPGARIIFKSSRKELAAVAILPEKIEAGVPHHPREKPVTSAIVKERRLGSEERKKNRSNHRDKAAVADEYPCIGEVDRRSVGLGEPVWRLGLDVTGMAASKVRDVVLSHDARSKDKVGRSTRYMAIHVDPPPI